MHGWGLVNTIDRISATNNHICRQVCLHKPSWLLLEHLLSERAMMNKEFCCNLTMSPHTRLVLQRSLVLLEYLFDTSRHDLSWNSQNPTWSNTWRAFPSHYESSLRMPSELCLRRHKYSYQSSFPTIHFLCWPLAFGFLSPKEKKITQVAFQW